MRVVARLLTLAVIVAAFSSAFAPEAAAQFAQPAAVTQQSLTPELEQAARAGYEAGMAKSTTRAGIFAGATSVVVPGGGLLFLLFAGDDRLVQDPVHAAHLNGKSEGYVRTWYNYYDKTFAARERKAILVGTGVGTVLWYVIVKPAMFPKRDLGYGYY